MNKEKLKHHALTSIMEAFIIHYGNSGELKEFLRIRGTNPGDYFCSRALGYANAIMKEIEEKYHSTDGTDNEESRSYCSLAAYALVAAVKALIIKYGDAGDIDLLVKTASDEYGLSLATIAEHPWYANFLLKDFQK